MRTNFRTAVFLMLLMLGKLAYGEDSIVFAGISEASGSGALAGISFRNGYQLAIEEINHAGGLGGKPISLKQFDIDTNPDAAKAAAQAAVAAQPFAILGPVFSGITLATLPITSAAGIPQFTGGEASSITKKYPPNLFRTSLTQEIAVPRMASFVKYAFQAKRVFVIAVDNEFGRDGKDIFLKSLTRLGVTLCESVLVKPGQKDFSEAAELTRKFNPDVLVIYTNEPEAVGILKAMRGIDFDKPIVGEGPLVSQQVIDLAGGAADGIFAHTGVSVDAPNQRIQDFSKRYSDKYQVRADHNSLKGYFAVYAIKAIVDNGGVTDKASFLAATKKARLDTARHPKVLVRGAYDMFGNLYRESYLVQIRNGKQSVLATIPLSEGQTIELAGGREVFLNSGEGRKQFFTQTAGAATDRRK